MPTMDAKLVRPNTYTNIVQRIDSRSTQVVTRVEVRRLLVNVYTSYGHLATAEIVTKSISQVRHIARSFIPGKISRYL